MTATASVLDLLLRQVAEERARQDAKWGASNIINRSPAFGLVVLMEEVGEAARADLEGERDDLCSELVQVAAVALAIAESVINQRAVAGMTVSLLRCQDCWATGLQHTQDCHAKAQAAGPLGYVTFRGDVPLPSQWYRWKWCRCTRPCGTCGGGGHVVEHGNTSEAPPTVDGTLRTLEADGAMSPRPTSGA